jgi:multidrug transporter EmrE-like cation transporter
MGLLFTGGIILTIGDIAMKKWVSDQNPNVYVFGLVIYLIGLNFLAQSFKYKNIAVASVIFVIFNVVTLSIVSWIFFKEKLSPLQIGGMFIGLASIITLEFASNS